jgi:hypothetical protein
LIPGGRGWLWWMRIYPIQEGKENCNAVTFSITLHLARETRAPFDLTCHGRKSSQTKESAAE